MTLASDVNKKNKGDVNMMNEGYSLSDIAAATGNSGCNNGGFAGDGSWWIILFLIFAIFGWGNAGYGYNNGGCNSGGGMTGYVSDNYALITDNATLERKIDGVYAGICDSTYALANNLNNGFAAAQNTMTQGFAGLNTAIVTQGYDTRNAVTQDTIANMQNANALQGAIKDCCCQTQQNIADVKYTIGSTGAGIQNQIQSCCCDVERQIERGFSDTNYGIVTQANMLDRTVSDKFCQTNFNAERNTRDIVDAQNAGTQAILNRLDAMETNRLREQLDAERTANAVLQGRIDRQQLRTDIVNDVRPCPIPAYPACNPFAPISTSNGCCGCNS